MGASKRKLKLKEQHAARPQKQKGRRSAHQDAPSSTPKKLPAPKKPISAAPRPQEKPTIPFSPEDRILLIGEGDLSFAASLVLHHGCTNVTATVLEKDAEELLAKYPEHHAAEVLDPETSNRIVYGVDATRPLPASIVRPPPNRILFNFPHVGGRSTDVNRQVRYNQELLVSFFSRAALPALAPGGSIVVTLFEGEPYTLWNVRDLARHAGLQVERSFRFRADVYPGYKHARTLGVVRSKTGEAGGGWKGEERPARSYVFVRKGDVPQPVSKKRRKDEESSSEED